MHARDLQYRLNELVELLKDPTLTSWQIEAVNQVISNVRNQLGWYDWHSGELVKPILQPIPVKESGKAGRKLTGVR